jgi:hypothetical protein
MLDEPIDLSLPLRIASGVLYGRETRDRLPRRVMTTSSPSTTACSSFEKAWLASRADTVRMSSPKLVT